jgi:GntR family transcriptional regulator
MDIRKNHPIPVYYQLAQELQRRIEAGLLKPGDLVPSERELADTYGISRMTVRQGLANLVSEGLLSRERGRGTFVTIPKIDKRLGSLTSFTEDMRSRGKRASSRVLSARMVLPTPRVVEGLKVPEGQMVALVERLRLADNEPVGIERAHLFFAGCEAVLERDLTGSLYQILRSELGVFPTSAEERIEAGACSPHEAEVLGITRQTPVLLITRITLTQHQRPFEFVDSVYRGDRYALRVSLSVAS